MKRGYKDLLEEARREVKEISAAELQALLAGRDAVLVDVRDIREIERDGRIEGSIHVPRGMLEFWIDPESPYFKPVFGEKKSFVFHCSLGWRSALAAQTAQTMGLGSVSHLGGGFEAWKAAGLPVGQIAPKQGL
jgi:rhodanese-related sulfurtransferase